MTNYSTELLTMWLASSGLRPDRLHILIEEYGCPEAVWEAFFRRQNDLRDILNDTDISLLGRQYHKITADGWEKRIREYGIHSVTILDEDFPVQLKTIPDPPPFLFYQGDLSALNGRCLAMIGSRRASYAGLQATEDIARDLSKAGIRIISGFAYGIDTAAHKGCLSGSSPTAAVLGCGLNINYPAENSDLRKNVLSHGGVLISEYVLDEKPLGAHFPVRNRIISGLSDAVILMEAQIRSGSMTTVNHAADQSRDVFVYPGDPRSELCSANHMLLREGAIYFTKAEDILEDMKWLDKEENVRQNIDCSKAQANLTETEKNILSALLPGALGFDQLVNKTGLDTAGLLSTLTMMQIKGLVVALPGKIYQLKQ